MDIGHLKALSAGLHMFSSAIACENHFKKLQGSSEKDRSQNEASYVQSYGDFVKESNPVIGPSAATEDHDALAFKSHLERFKSTHRKVLEGCVEESANKIATVCARMSSRLIDVKALAKDVDKNLSQLVDWPHRAEFLEDLKVVTAMLTNFSKFKDMFSAIGVQVVADKDLAKTYDDSIGVRQSARLQVVARSAGLIIQKERAADIPTLDSQAKSLKVSLPKQIRAKLDALLK